MNLDHELKALHQVALEVLDSSQRCNVQHTVTNHQQDSAHQLALTTHRLQSETMLHVAAHHSITDCVTAGSPDAITFHDSGSQAMFGVSN